MESYKKKTVKAKIEIEVEIIGEYNPHNFYIVTEINYEGLNLMYNVPDNLYLEFLEKAVDIIQD